MIVSYKTRQSWLNSSFLHHHSYSTSHELYTWFVLSCGLLPVFYTHIIQGYFTALGQSYDSPSASEATLKNIGKYITQNSYKLIIKTQQNKNAISHEHILWDILCVHNYVQVFCVLEYPYRNTVDLSPGMYDFCFSITQTENMFKKINADKLYWWKLALVIMQINDEAMKKLELISVINGNYFCKKLFAVYNLSYDMCNNRLFLPYYALGHQGFWSSSFRQWLTV